MNTLLDRGFIGHLEPAALTAHGGSINVVFLCFSLAMALATGATALVSRAFGAEERAEYRMASRQALGLAVMAGFIVAVAAFVVGPLAARWILPPDDKEAIVLMGRFLQWFAAGLPALFVIQTLAVACEGWATRRAPWSFRGCRSFCTWR